MNELAASVFGTRNIGSIIRACIDFFREEIEQGKQVEVARKVILGHLKRQNCNKLLVPDDIQPRVL